MKPTKEILADILQEVRPLIGQGKVADYIPALANIPAKKLAIAVFTNQGKVIKAGDADEAFSIQSISKALSLTLAMDIYTPEEIWSRVGKEPSGQAFNSLIQLEMEQGIPLHKRMNTLSITDRKNAIKTACSLAQKGDILLVAGKGHEKYQEINGTRHPFDDKAVLSEFITQ